MRSRRSAGSRRPRDSRAPARFSRSSCVGCRQDPQPPFVHEALVDRAEPTGKRRVHRNAERGRLAVHRAAGRDDEIAERDEALCVDRVVGNDERRKSASEDVVALLGGARKDDGVDVSSATQPLEHVGEQRVSVPVVQGHIGRRADDDENPLAIEPEFVEDGAVGLEARELVLLLEPRVAAHLRSRRAEAVESILRDRIGDDHAASRAAAEPVLHPRELVVERV